jgi:uncharacterized protein (DUF362 family)
VQRNGVRLAGLALAAAALMLWQGPSPVPLGLDAVSAATRPGQSVIGSVASDYVLLSQPQPRAADLDAEAVATLVRWSNNLSYGLANVAPPGAGVVVLLPTVRPEATTDVRVLAGVIRLCGELLEGPEFIVGVPGKGQVPAAYTALPQLVGEGFQVQVRSLGADPLRPLPAMTGLVRKSYDLPQSLAMADAVILVPALWRGPDGTVHGALDVVAALAPGGAAGDSVGVDLVSAVDPLYVFADALRPPVKGAAQPLNALLAGTDPCAVDAVGSQLVGATPADVPGLALAAQKEIGKLQWVDIKLNGSPVPGVPQESDSDPDSADTAAAGR